MAEALYYREKDKRIYIQARGHITAQICADLREQVFSRFDEPVPVLAIYVDLSSCDYMDSTFMGLLAGFNKRLVRMQNKRISIVKASVSAKKLLDGLGLSPLLEFVDTNLEFPGNMIQISGTHKANAELLLKAHENLMELSEDNKKKFSGLHDVLKKQQEDNKD